MVLSCLNSSEIFITFYHFSSFRLIKILDRYNVSLEKAPMPFPGLTRKSSYVVSPNLGHRERLTEKNCCGQATP